MTRRIGNAMFLLLLIPLALSIGCRKDERSGGSASSSPSGSASATSGGEFEGTIVMKMNSPESQQMEMTYFIKGQHSRLEPKMIGRPDVDAVMLWDLSAGKITTLMPTQKVYMTMDVKRMAESVKGMTKEQNSNPEELPPVTPTGRTETIAGHECEHWLMGDKQQVDMCVAKGLGYFGMSGASGRAATLQNLVLSPKLIEKAASHPEWVKLLEGGAFPLKVTVTENNQQRMSMEATSIERKKLDDSLFTIPSDYKDMSSSMPFGR